MGVPITFLDKYNPNQFEIVGQPRWITYKELVLHRRSDLERGLNIRVLPETENCYFENGKRSNTANINPQQTPQDK